LPGGRFDGFPHLRRFLALLSVPAQQTVDAYLAFYRNGLRAPLPGIVDRFEEWLVSLGGSGPRLRFGLVQPLFYRREQAGHLRPSPLVASGGLSHVLADVDGKNGGGIEPDSREFGGALTRLEEGRISGFSRIFLDRYKIDFRSPW